MHLERGWTSDLCPQVDVTPPRLCKATSAKVAAKAILCFTLTPAWNFSRRHLTFLHPHLDLNKISTKKNPSTPYEETFGDKYRGQRRVAPR